jgi:hypothetical protein
VTEKMRVGEMLLLKERIDPWILTRTLKEQATTRQRLVSILVSRALLEYDDGAMVLSEQLGYPAAMQRHLERRDPDLISAVPHELGGRWVVLPIGRAKTGSLIICARDPSPILQAALEHATQSSIVLAVAPAIQLERLVRAAYGLTAPAEEPLPSTPPTVSDIGNFRLEDTPRPNPPPRRPRTVSDMYIRTDPELPPTRAPTTAAQLDTALDEIERAVSAPAAERLVLAYAAKRWHSALIARVEDGYAVGNRGHNVEHVESVALSLRSPSVLQVAHDTRRPSADRRTSGVQQELVALLGSQRLPTAAPITANSEVVALIAVGDPLPDGPREALAELDRLADALGAAYDRFHR